MGFIYHYEKILRKIIYEGIGPGACRQSVKVPGIVFYAFAGAYFSQHFQIISGPLFYALGFQQLAPVFEPAHPFFQLFVYGLESVLHFFR